LIEVRLALNVPSFLGLWRDEPEFFLVRLEITETLSRLDIEVVLRRPSFVPIIEPEMALPETEVPVGDEPARLFPDEPGLNLGGGGGGPFPDLCNLVVEVWNGSGSGQVPVPPLPEEFVPLDELVEAFLKVFRIRPVDFLLFDEWLFRTITPRASFSSLLSLGGGGGDLK